MLRFDRSEDAPEGNTRFQISPCGPNTTPLQSSLRSDQAQLFEFEIDDGSGAKTRRFIVALVSANHVLEPPWSRFVIIELAR